MMPVHMAHPLLPMIGGECQSPVAAFPCSFPHSARPRTCSQHPLVRLCTLPAIGGDTCGRCSYKERHSDIWSAFHAVFCSGGKDMCETAKIHERYAHVCVPSIHFSWLQRACISFSRLHMHITPHTGARVHAHRERIHAARVLPCCVQIRAFWDLRKPSAPGSPVLHPAYGDPKGRKTTFWGAL